MHERFEPELFDQMFPLGSENLADSDFFYPSWGLPDGKIHEIEAGNHQDKQRDPSQDKRVADGALLR